MALHPRVVVGDSSVSGRGLFATETIPSGTVVWHPCDKCVVLDRRTVSLLPWSELRHWNEFGYHLSDRSVLFPCGNAHLFNHSCEANVLDAGLDFGVAVTEIHAGDEMYCDYRSFKYDPRWCFNCNCSCPNCLQTISTSSYLTTDLKPLLRRVRNAVCFLSTVDQPLEESLLRWSKAYPRLLEDPDLPLPIAHIAGR